MATDQQEQPTDETSRVTAAALAAAKDVINNGGTQSEAAAAAKQVATNMLLKSKKKESGDSSMAGGSDKSGKDSANTSSPSDKSGKKDGVVGSDKASLATPPKKISTDKDTPKTSMSTKKNKSGKDVVVSGHPSSKSTSTKATATTTTNANATVSTNASSSNAGSRLFNKFRKKKSSNDKVKKQKKKKSKKIGSKQKPVAENKQTTATARSKVKTVPEEESNNKEDRVLTYSPNNEQQTQEVISQVSKSLNKSKKVGLTTAAKSAIQSIRNKSPTLPTQSKSKHTKKRHPDYHPNHTTKQKHHHRRRTSSSVGSLTNSSGGTTSSGSSGSGSSCSTSYYYDTNTESLDSYEIEMLYNRNNIPAILDSVSSNASSYAQLRGKADQSNNDARGRSVESEDRYSPSIMSMYGLLDAVDDVLFPHESGVKESKKERDNKKDTSNKKEKKNVENTPKDKKETPTKSKVVDNTTKEKAKEKSSTTEKKESNKKVVIEKTPDKESGGESSWFWKLCGATQLLNCTETSIKTDDCSSTFQEDSQGSTTLDDYSSSNKEESILSLEDGTDNTTKSGTAVSTNKGKEVSSTTTSNEGKTREVVTAEMLLQEVKNEKREKKVSNNDADDSTLDSSLLKAIGRGVMRDARKNSSSNKSTTSKVEVEKEESSLILGKVEKDQVNTDPDNGDKKVVPVAASNENESVSSKMKTMFRNTMGRCSVNPQYCNSQNLDNSLHYPGQQSQPPQQPAAALDDNPNWRDLVEDTVQTKQTAPAHTVVREQSNISQPQIVVQGQGYQVTSGYQASPPPSTSQPSQHLQVGHVQTSVQPQQQHHFSPQQQVGGYQGNNQVVQGGYQGSPSIQMNSPPQASQSSQTVVEQVWQPNYQVKPPVKTYSPSVPKVNSNFSVESMDEREDRYAGMEPQEEERREDPVMMGTAQPSTSSAVVYSNNVLDQRQQYQQQANGSTHMIRQDYNGGGHQFNAQHTRPPMMSNGNPNLSIQSPQYQQQHQYRPQQSVVQTRAPMPQTRPQFNSMPPSNIPRQQQQYHKPQQPQQQRPQQLPASFHHRVDPNPSSVGYYKQANRPQQAYHGGYRTFAA